MTMRAIVLLLALAIIFFTAPANSKLPPHAQKLWQTAQDLYKNKQYAEAGKAFESVFNAHETRAALFNAAKCYDKANDAENALRMYKNFVRFGLVAGKSKKTVMAAIKRIDTLEARLSKTHAWVSITVTPADAIILLNDNPAEIKAPLNRWLVAGTYQVQVKKQGYKPQKQVLEVTPGKNNETLKIQLLSMSIEGRLTVLSNHNGAQVFLDGLPLGKTPVSDTGVATGKHALKVTTGGHKAFEKSIHIEAGKNTTITANLVASVNTVWSAKISDSVFKTWWFWTAVGTVVAGTVTATILLNQPDAQKNSPTAADLGTWEPISQ